MRNIHRILAVLFFSVMRNAFAQAFPSKLIRIVVPTAPGNAADITGLKLSADPISPWRPQRRAPGATSGGT
jgi:tripartite-type tricarboxylate transporter receptor subunit TctC